MNEASYIHLALISLVKADTIKKFSEATVVGPALSATSTPTPVKEHLHKLLFTKPISCYFPEVTQVCDLNSSLKQTDNSIYLQESFNK